MQANIDPNVFLHFAARPLFFFHAVAGVAFAGISAHVLLSATRRHLSGQTGHCRLERFVTISLCVGLVVLALGFLIYPEYKANIRVAFINNTAPGVGKLFDIKEYLAVFTLPLSVFLFAGVKRFCKARDKVFGLLYLASLYLWFFLIWSVAIIGWYTTTVKSLGVA
ncbi:MAG: hypothetical protein GXP49_04900 [Deltaproteobacteria bacterium]|nr:hypothetical protein [Deltaproteobacteria bacterium]